MSKDIYRFLSLKIIIELRFIGGVGFISVPETSQITFDLNLINNPLEDVFFQNTRLNASIGGLFIELGSRRRFRTNGHVKRDNDILRLKITEAFANCPKYIQRRIIKLQNDPMQASKQLHGVSLTKEQLHWIGQSDIFFVGSQGDDNRMDVNHRGGNSGFIEVINDKTLKIPDYVGNNLFNTLGNFLVNPNAGLLFIDFDGRRTLQLSGKGEVLSNQDTDIDQAKTMGTGRYWLFHVKEWIQTEQHHNGNWDFLENSPFNPALV